MPMIDFDDMPDEYDREWNDPDPPKVYINPIVEYETEKALKIFTVTLRFWVPKSIIIERNDKHLIVPGWFTPNLLKR